MKFYLKTLQDKYNYRGTWAPYFPIKVGMVGRLHRGSFIPYGNLKDMGIPFKEDFKAHEYGNSMEFATSDVEKIELDQSANLTPTAATIGKTEVGLRFEFGSDRSFVFKINGPIIHYISNLGEVETETLRRFKANEWNRKNLIVTEVIKSTSSTIITSLGSGGVIELNGKADVGMEKLDIADASLGWHASRERRIGEKVIAQSEISPLYKIAAVQRVRIIGPWELDIKKSIGGDEEIKLSEVPFDEHGFDED